MRRLAGAVVCIVVLVATSVSTAEPLRRPLYPQDRLLFDLIVRTSDDPDLLTPRQTVLQEQWRRLGVRPGGETPSLATVFQARAAERADFDRFGPSRVRRERTYDVDGGIAAEIVVPEASLFSALEDTNAVGVAFRTARDVSRPDLRLDVSSIDAHLRAAAAIKLQEQWEQQIRNRAASGDGAGDLLNFTIPIKIPRTLERIIGRGDATNIRISGTEQIRIGGQSTVRNNFLGNEIQQNQSLFPQLELEQQLRVNLDGQVGEKIKVRVSHDSQRVGAESTEIRLSFEGDEDDIVQTIRAGDIDVTLPGSNLLGVGASRGGLFGLKVEGALGPVRYTVLTSKEESTQESRSFSQSGGTTEEETVVIRDIDYSRGRFFRLTAPSPLYFTDPTLLTRPNAPIDGSQNVRGVGSFEDATWRIDPATVEVYTLAGPGVSDQNTVDHGIAVLDDSGLGWEGFGAGVGVGPPGLPPNATDEELAQYLIENYAEEGKLQTGTRWRRLRRGDTDGSSLGGADWYPLGDLASGQIIGIEMARSYSDREVLAVTYDIVDENDEIVRRVGRSTIAETSQLPNLNFDGDPNDLGDLVNEPRSEVPFVQFFKLLKPRNPTNPIDESGDFVPLALTWEYEFRNFYDLRGRNIDPASFQLEIERNNTAIEFPEREETSNLPWIQIYGLDQLNASNQEVPDNRVDLDDSSLFNLTRGVLQFPVSRPFAMSPEQVQDFSRGQLDSIPSDLRAPQLYTRLVNTRQEQVELNRFNIVVQQAGVSSNLRLNTFNIREGSEEVILNGRPLDRGTDYDIDYFTGEINLKGDALAELNDQSNIQVRYEQNPLFGGGRTSLSGVNLQGELFRRTQVSTTWLYQTRPNAQTKVRLGEEPKRNLVGNFNAKSRIEPDWMTPFAEWLSRQNVDRAPSFDLTAEVAVSVPNPNTRDIAYLEDFEQVDQTVQITLGREGWVWASLPVRGPDLRPDRRTLPEGEPFDEPEREAFEPADRAYVGWHRPAQGGSLLQGQINPALTELEQNDLIPTLEMIVRADASDTTDPEERGGWEPDEYAGIMRSLGEVDLTQAQFLEFWVDAGDEPIVDGREVNPGPFGNAIEAFQSSRSGTLHFDFGDINEDYYWARPDSATYLMGIEDREDRDNDGILGIAEDGQTEDRGLDGLLDTEEADAIPAIAGRPGRPGDPGGDDYALDDPNEERLERGEFVYVNGTEGNQRLDGEDINRDGSFDLEDGFYRVSVDLDDPNALVDIYRDFTDDDFQPLPGFEGFINEALNERRTWRRFRLDLREALRLVRGETDLNDDTPYFGREPDLSRVRTLRIWYEPDGPQNPDEPNTRRIRLADMRFLGNRWISDQVRDRYDRIIEPEQRGEQDFRLGVLNNKDNAGTYTPPIEVVRRNNQDELEQSLQLTYEIERGNGFRAFKDLPGRNGENYLNYDELNFFWRLPYGFVAAEEDSVFASDPTQYDLEGFYWVGSDSLNYYEIAVPFDEVLAGLPNGEPEIVGNWLEISVGLAELSNVRTSGEEVPLVEFPDDPSAENPLVRKGTVRDTRNGVEYPVTVRGRPDLERVTRFYLGVRAPADGTLARYRGEVLFNELRLRGVNREIGFAQRYAMNAQIPGVADLQLDFRKQDAEFRGLNREFGTQINSTAWNGRVATKLQNWIPTGGIDLPITVQRSTELDLPKYEPDSDRELLTEAEQREFRSERTTERFSLQFRKPRPSENWLLKYTVDRFSYSINGTRTERFTPKLESSGKSADQRYSYDLQLRSPPTIPVPFVPLRLGFFPRQVQVTSNWQFSQSQSVQKSLITGEVIPRPVDVRKQNTNQLQLTLEPVTDLSTSMSFNSGRNQLLDGGLELFGIDFGVEETFSQNLGMQFKPNYRWLQWARPTVNYTGSYNENRRGTIRVPASPSQADEPLLVPEGDGRLGRAGEVRNITNRADWNVRSDFDVKGFLGTVTGPFRALGGLVGGLVPGGGGGETSTSGLLGPSSPAGAPRTPGFFQQGPQEPSGEREEPEDGGDEPAPTGAAPADSTAAEEDPGPLLLRLDYLSLLKKTGTPFVNFWENLRPLGVTWQQQRNSSYNQVGARADLLYRFGFNSRPDFASMTGVPTAIDSTSVPGEKIVIREDFIASSQTRNRTFSVSAQSKLSSKINVDANYRRTSTERDGAAGARGSSSIEWPSYNVRVQGVSDWGIWDAIGDPFTSSNLDFSYKRTETRADAPLSTPLPPRVNRTIQPRWNVRLKSGLDANLSVTINNDQSTSLQSSQFSDSIRLNLTLRQNFDAEGRLSFLRFGRSGTGSTIDMTVNASFLTSTSYREIAEPQADGSTVTKRDQEQGRRNLTISPQFSYQFSRNLRASLQLDFSRREITQQNDVTTSFGVFFEATLNF